MSSITVNYTLIWCLDFADNYQWTKCGKCFNVKTNKQLKKVYNNGCIGYNINGKFKSLTYLRKHLIKIKTNLLPF